jgi:hypothetical protein
MNKQIQQLEEEGFEVEVSHLRATSEFLDWYKRQPRQPGFPYPWRNMLGTAGNLRREGLVPSGRGGITCVQIIQTVKDTQILLVEGFAYCNPNENFDKKLGTQIALGRALAKL